MIGRTARVVAVLAVLVVAPSAGATTVGVRVEGKTQTLFEGKVNTSVHQVRAASDSQSRVCDTTNGGHASAISATAALDDAATVGGFDWDAYWSPGFNEYYMNRVGPDAEDNAQDQWWGLLVNGKLADLGGCAQPVAAGDEVLWAYDAFSQTKALALSGPDTVKPGQQLEVSVTDTFGGDPVDGAAVGGQTTDAGGKATLTFAAAGQQLLKASAPGAIRSNALEVCVQADPADCPALQPPVDPPAGTGSVPAIVGGASPAVKAAVQPPKKACAGRGGKALKRCKALNKCKKVKGKKKRARCRARARKIGNK